MSRAPRSDPCRRRLPIVLGMVLVSGVFTSAALPAVTDAQLPGPPSVPGVHERITILGDADLTPANGIRSGNGTPNDPYVLSRWTIPDTGGLSIGIRDTTAHILIEDVVVTGTIHLINAPHVTIHDAVVQYAWNGIRVHDSRDVGIDRVEINVPTPTGAVWTMLTGVSVSGSTNVTISNISISGAAVPLGITGSTGLLVEGSTLEGVGRWSYVANSRDITFRDSTLVDGTIWLAYDDGGRNGRITLVNNLFARGTPAILSESAEAVYACGNTFAGGGVDIAAGRIRLAGNTFDGSGTAARLTAGSVEADANVIRASTSWGLTATGGSIRAAGNLFEHNQKGHAFRGFGGDDLATHNWWGSADGPSGDGPGSGDAVTSDDVTFEPWLTEPPGNVGAGSIDCETDLAAWALADAAP